MDHIIPANTDNIEKRLHEHYMGLIFCDLDKIGPQVMLGRTCKTGGKGKSCQSTKTLKLSIAAIRQKSYQ